jgi:uncharacterized membrane protein
LAFIVIVDHSAPAGNRVAEQVDDGDAVNLEQFFQRATQAFEVLGVSSMVLGTGYAIGLAAFTWRRTGGARAFKTLRNAIGGAILLGLELLVAADIVKTVTSKPSLTDAAILGVIVLIRTVLSFTIEVEIDGVAPWRKAVTTGPEVLARTTRTARSPSGPGV